MANEQTAKFAAALNEQGRFAQVCVGDFTLLPEVGRHIWKGKVAETIEELAEHINGALKSISEFGDPFLTLAVVAVSQGEQREAKAREENSEIILEANRQLQDVIEHVTPKKLRPLAAATTA